MGLFFPIYGEIRNVPNQQPAIYIVYLYIYIYTHVCSVNKVSSWKLVWYLCIEIEIWILCSVNRILIWNEDSDVSIGISNRHLDMSDITSDNGVITGMTRKNRTRLGYQMPPQSWGPLIRQTFHQNFDSRLSNIRRMGFIYGFMGYNFMVYHGISYTKDVIGHQCNGFQNW